MRFLPFVCIALIACGCAGNDQYSMEREYWYLGKMAEHIAANPSAAPQGEVERVVKRFADFSGRHRGTSLGLSAEFAIARIYMVKSEPVKARERLEAVVRAYDSPEIKAEGYFLIGRTYQENDWGAALEYYGRVVKEYPLTKRGLGLSVYIAEYYRDHFEPEKMVAAYGDAIARYKEIAARYPGSPLSLEARLMASGCYGGLKEWGSAVEVLEGVVAEFRAKVEMDGVLMNIALICKKELKDMNRFRGALERLVREYPGSRLVSTAKALLKSSADGKLHGEG